MSFLRGVIATLAAILVQALAASVVGCLDLMGLLSLQRVLLEWQYVFYSPAIRLFQALTPQYKWVRGNFLLGFFAVGFGICLYACFIGLVIGTLSVWAKLWKGRKTMPETHEQPRKSRVKKEHIVIAAVLALLALLALALTFFSVFR